MISLEKKICNMNIIFDYQSINISHHYSSPETQHSQTNTGRPTVLKYTYFQTVCTPKMRLLSGCILPRDA